MDRAGPPVLAALGPAVLLAVDPWGWYPFGPIKWLLVLALGLAGSTLALRDARPRVPRPLMVAELAFLGWLGLAAAVGDDPVYAWTGTPERHLGAVTWALCALLLAVGTTLDDRGARRVARGLVVAGLGVGGIATAEALGWEPQVLDVASRLSGPLGSPAYLGAATALLLPIALGLAAANRPLLTVRGGGSASAGTGASHEGPVSSSPRGVEPSDAGRLEVAPPGVGRHRNGRIVGWAAAVAAALLAVACIGSGARAAWVGLAVAAIAVTAAHARAVAAAVRERPARAGAGVVAVAVVIGAVLLLTPASARIADAADPDAAGGRGRLDEWRVAATVVADHPVVGVGPEGYRTAVHEGVDERYEREHGRRQQPDRAHSAPLDVALAGGLPLLAAWGAVLALVGRAAWRVLRAGEGWERGIAAGLVAHWSGQLLLFPVVELEPIAWLLAGLVIARAPARAPALTPAPPLRTRDAGTTGTSRRHRTFASRWVGPVLGVLALVGLVAGVTDVMADHRAQRAVDALARGDHRAATDAADSAAALRPDIVRLHLLAARAAVADQQGALAGLGRVDDALTVSPRDPIALLQRLTLLVARAESTQTDAHKAEARAALDDRLERDPYAAALWRLDARLARVEGDLAAAERAQARADELTPPEERP